MIYDFFLFVYVLIFSFKAIFELIFYKKKRSDLLKRLGIKSYDFDPNDKKPIIWIHAVSLGETKAAKSLLETLKKLYKNSYIVISSQTQTGHAEAKKTLSKADKFVYLPIDFSFSVKRLFRQIKPDAILFIETDIWPNFIKQAKKNGSKLILISAKMSEKSEKRYLRFYKFSKNLFSKFDLILTQNDSYKKAFEKFTSKNKVFSTGNLKLINFPKIYSEDFLKNLKDKLNIKNQKVIMIASTHDDEEELLINSLKDLKNTLILLAPRHPERFHKVYNKISKIISCSLFSKLREITIDQPNNQNKIILIDQMGVLNQLFQISDLAILGGSFIDRVGGHNILEPILVNTPVFFGPNMYSQLDLEKIALESCSGKKVSLKNINFEVRNFLEKKSQQQQMINNCINIKKDLRKNILDSLLDKIQNLIPSS